MPCQRPRCGRTPGAAAGIRRLPAKARPLWGESGFVPGAGATETPQHYAFRVDNLAPGAHRFRLRQTDFDGASTLSQEVEVTVSQEGTHALAVWPNPASGAAATGRLTVAEAQPVTVALYDGLGRRVAVLHAGEASGTVTVRVPAGLAPGVYLVRAEGAAFAETLRVTVLD